MILTDSSVWIDYFRGALTVQTQKLHRLIGNEPLIIGDLILMEVLQGFTSGQDFQSAKRLLTSLPPVELGGQAIAIQAAKNFRFLRLQGVTIRKSIDTLIATWCIENGCALLHCDREFEPFEKHLALRIA